MDRTFEEWELEPMDGIAASVWEDWRADREASIYEKEHAILEWAERKAVVERQRDALLAALKAMMSDFAGIVVSHPHFGLSKKTEALVKAAYDAVK